MEARMQERLVMAGLGASDIAWFESFGCDDARVPTPRADELGAFRRREAALNAAVAELSFAERGASAEGKLAAAIGAKVADAQEGDEE